MRRLTSKSTLPGFVRQPHYIPENHGIGIVHFGLGSFHRAHQAVYTDDALEVAGGNWRILGVSLRSDSVSQKLSPQDGRYLMLEQGINLPEQGKLRLLGSIADVKVLALHREEIMQALCAQHTKIVSLTITEKAYYIDRIKRVMQIEQPAVGHDLANPEAPNTAIGLIVLALMHRFKLGMDAFTVLCCDNLPDNGALLKAGVLDFAKRVNPNLAEWIADEVAFPSTMVDRITPAMTPDLLSEISSSIGFEDQAAVVTESFSQWIVEDHFPYGRPAWEQAGAVFVDDVAPFEKMKLRMLNGSHSLLAYAGFMAGCETVSDAMAFEPIAILVKEHLKVAAATLQPVAQIDYQAYAAELCERFENPKLRHATYQIAMDGTEKLQQRLLHAAVESLQNAGEQKTFVIAIAVWMRYCLGVNEAGEVYELRDPRQDEIGRVLNEAVSNKEKVQALLGLPNLFPEELLGYEQFNDAVVEVFELIQDKGIRTALQLFSPKLLGV